MITRLNIERRERFANSYEFPVSRAYEKLAGKLHGEVNPNHPLNKTIVNLDRAPRNRQGCVEYWSDFCLLKPLVMARGNGKIFFEAPNRGSKRILSFLNDAPASNDPSTLEHAGNGFLMRQGYTIVWCGWQGDLMPLENWLVMGVPVATDSGKEIVRNVRTEMVVTEKGIKSQPLSGDERVKSYEAESQDKSLATLTVREQSYGNRIAVPPQEWEFASAEIDAQSGEETIRPSSTDLYLRSGYTPGHIYEFIYRAKNPLVLGLGFAVVRDLVSFLRYEIKDTAGQFNPLATNEKTTPIRYAFGWGRSQSGRFLRDFVYHGFNADESRRKVFDAVAPHVAGGGRMFLNYEFARPVTSSQQHTNQLEPELFPHAYNVIEDAQTGRRDGILKRPKTDPYIFHTQTSTEYWQKRGCLAHTDGRGNDIDIPDSVRIYVIASAQHNSPFGSEPEKDNTQQLANPMPAGDVLRALVVALDLWITQGVSPPPSQFPAVRHGTLVKPDRSNTGFPEIPGVRYGGLYNCQLFLDYGPNLLRGQMEIHPPKQIEAGEYTILVPKVDADGNDIAGIRLPAIAVPIGTYTGWNLQASDLAEDELSGLIGSFIPFARTAAERRTTGDTRLSIEERYRDQAEYVGRVARAAWALIEQRVLLSEDADRIIREAERCKIFGG